MLGGQAADSVTSSLTLTAGLPATLSPPSTGLIRTFGTHPSAELGDLKLAGLAELVDIVQRASVSCGDPSLRSLDAISLRVLNLNLDDWATNWADVLGPKLRESFLVLTVDRLMPLSSIFSPHDALYCLSMVSLGVECHSNSVDALARSQRSHRQHSVRSIRGRRSCFQPVVGVFE